jgi:excisionase family DNA binding protein
MTGAISHPGAVSGDPLAQDRLLTAQEVGEYLGVSARQVANLADEGQIRSKRVGRYLRFRPEWVLAYVEDQ